MQVLNDSDYKLFKSIASVSQESLRQILLKYLNTKYDKVYSKKEYLYAPGEIPIALVAHMDTVFKQPPKSIYYDEKQGVLWSPQGLGADDRAGVFAILKILQSGLRPTIIFTTDEEIGCVGAQTFVKDFKKPLTDLRYIIQLDRRGTCDCVFYDCDNKPFVKYVEQFGFIENFGSFTDICFLCPPWEIAGVNLSIGYENEHSEIETLHVSPMLKTISNVKKMLQETNIPKFEYIPSPPSFSWYKGFNSTAKNPYYWDIPLDEDEKICDGCGKMFSEYEVIPAVTKEGEYKFFCPDCCVDHIDWCDACNVAFDEPYDKSPHYCYTCRKGIKKVKYKERKRS